ncbi:MAG: dTDP-4-dehydrorhamnose 3,5-epimerase [Alphaproteobacteria bacterium HGW-Alphaproteobacteria-11]|nr:MAG: dTDP-4-dehydrorhamnose 3,5-epimerase [Alphaproteobacteria bacterium HGW-Alphaproteobacteria-11]
MTDRFVVSSTPLSGVKSIRRNRVGDARGWLERLFCKDDLAFAGWIWDIAQINRTLTLRKNTVRGMHFQAAPYEEAKLITCLKGKVFDVAVDLRPSSPTYRHWHGEILSDANDTTLLIPPGFAHGFQALSDNVEMLYFHSAPYAAAYEGGVRADDPALAIRWPREIAEMSDRDRSFPLLDDLDEDSGQ